MTIKLSIQVKDLVPVDTDEEYFMRHSADTPFVITNDKTTNLTTGIGPCVGIAICAKDMNGVCHRIVCHCPYAPPVPTYRLEGRIEKYLKSIGSIKELSVVMASFNTFFENNMSDFSYERDSLIVDRINELFAFWKKDHPDFEIKVVQSTSIGITPDGEFLCDSIEEKKEHYLTESTYDDFNTTFSVEGTTLSAVKERLKSYTSNKDNAHLK